MVQKNLGDYGSNLEKRSGSHRKTKNEKKIPEEENRKIERRKRGKRKKVSIDKLFLDPVNVRGEIRYEDDDAFADDIERHGVEQNLVVRPIDYVSDLIAEDKLKLVEQGYKYAVLSGGRRLRAAKERGIKKVWCIVKELQDYHAAGRSIAENITKHDPPMGNVLHVLKRMISTIEKETKSFSELIKKLQEEIGVGRRTAYRYWRASRLPFVLLDLLNPPEQRKKEWEVVFEDYIKGGWAPCDPNKEQLALTVAEYIGRKIMANVNVDWSDKEELHKLQDTCILCMCKNKKDAYAFIDKISPIWTEIENVLLYDPYIIDKYGKTNAKTEEPKKKEVEEPSRPEPLSSSEKAYVTKMKSVDNISDLVFHINYILDWFGKVKDHWWRGIFQHTLSSLEKISEIYDKHKVEFD